jgi:hypothetical protein
MANTVIIRLSGETISNDNYFQKQFPVFSISIAWGYAALLAELTYAHVIFLPENAFTRRITFALPLKNGMAGGVHKL